MNIVLIGMPTCGKSTVGVVVAKMLGLAFVDTDILIQNREGKKLKDIIDEKGNDGFEKVESEVIENISVENTVIATGGSAVYSPKAMARLKEIAKVVYLAVDIEEIEKRMTDMRNRGVVFKKGQGVRELYLEREPLYEKYADYVVSEKGKTLEQTVEAVVNLFE
ncbi:MAG: shikimate kinase [Eubacteriales bacterium]|nr:shikimate kinase [Eubacteriales bacterium]MDY5440202.1 shikimate kinase [Eubacteriales bacterium]